MINPEKIGRQVVEFSDETNLSDQVACSGASCEIV